MKAASAFAVFFVSFLTVPRAHAQRPNLDALAATIRTYEFGHDREPLAQFTRQVDAALSQPAQARRVESALLGILESKSTAAAKDFALRQLSRIGGSASTPALAKALSAPDTFALALYAIERIPGDAASTALRDALPRQDGPRKISVINALGRRRDERSVPAIASMLSSPDTEVAVAAASALGEVGDATALKALAAGNSNATLREPLAAARLRCAERLAASGDRAAALSAFRELAAPSEPRHVRIAALAALARHDQAGAVPLLTRELSSPDAKIQVEAIRLLSGVRVAAVTQSLVQLYSKVPASVQITLLAALADRRDPAALPLLVSAAKASSGAVRIAALSALGKAGDASTSSLLADVAAASQGDEQSAARDALYSLRGKDIDGALVAALAGASGPRKVELIMAAGERGVAAAADSLIAAVADADPAVHREALRALRNVAGSAQVPALLHLLVQAKSAADRRETVQTLASVLKRSEASKVQDVVAAYRGTAAMPARLALLEVMGQTSSNEALPVLRAELRSEAPETRRAAILAVSEWATAEPMPDLLALARDPSNLAVQVLALRGYLKLLAHPSARTPVETAKALGEAMRLATQAAEKRTILSMLANYPCAESLAVAEATVKDETVAREARAAVERIKGLLKFQ